MSRLPKYLLGSFGLLVTMTTLSAFAGTSSGINTQGTSTLPIGAADMVRVTIDKDGLINFLNDTGTSTAYINSRTGASSFGSASFSGLLVANDALQVTKNLTVSKDVTIVNSGAAATATDLSVAHRMASGDQASGGNGGLSVGPNQFFGSQSSSTFGLWGGSWDFLLSNVTHNVGIGTPPTTNKLEVNGTVSATNFLAAGSTNPLTGDKIDMLQSLQDIATCSAGEALQKTGAKTFACVSLTGATATLGTGKFDGVMKYEPGTNTIYYWNQALGQFDLVNLTPAPTCPTVTPGKAIFTSSGTHTPIAGLSTSCPLPIRYIVVGGGGAGGAGSGGCGLMGAGGGGGGSGNIQVVSTTLTSSAPISVTVGTGGMSSSFNGTIATPGSSGGAGSCSGNWGYGGNGGAGSGGGAGGGRGCGTISSGGGAGGRIGANGGGDGIWCSGSVSGTPGSGGAGSPGLSVTSSSVNGVNFTQATFSSAAAGGEGGWDGGCCGSQNGYGYNPGAYGYGSGGSGGGGGCNAFGCGGGGGGGGGGLYINGSGASSGGGAMGSSPSPGGNGGAGAPGVVYIEW